MDPIGGLLLMLICTLQYRGWNPDKAVEDYYSRIRDHEKYYQPLEETTWPSIRIINVCFLPAPRLPMDDAEKSFVGWGTGYHECELVVTYLLQRSDL
jgi:hypothetical protein